MTPGNKTLAWEPPAQEMAESNEKSFGAVCRSLRQGTLQKTGQPTNERAFILNGLIRADKEILFSEFIKTYVREDGRTFFEPVDKDELLQGGFYRSAVREKKVAEDLVTLFINHHKSVCDAQEFYLNYTNVRSLLETMSKLVNGFGERGEQLYPNRETLYRVLRAGIESGVLSKQEHLLQIFSKVCCSQKKVNDKTTKGEER